MTDATEQATDPMAELTAMTEIAKALRPLDSESVRRVLEWAADRFGASGKIAARQRANNLQRVEANNGEIQAESIPTAFNDIADLYSAAKPKGDPEKALVVAYWVQRLTGQADFDAATINKELKHLGHGVGNITSALGSLITRKPQLVIQTRKTGSSQQARKRYKLTNEGLKHVDRMIQGEG